MKKRTAAFAGDEFDAEGVAFLLISEALDDALLNARKSPLFDERPSRAFLDELDETLLYLNMAIGKKMGFFDLISGPHGKDSIQEWRRGVFKRQKAAAKGEDPYAQKKKR